MKPLLSFDISWQKIFALKKKVLNYSTARFIIIFHIIEIKREKERSGVNFINILRTAFTLVRPKSAKRHCQLDCLFCAFRICKRKSCT